MIKRLTIYLCIVVGIPLGIILTRSILSTINPAIFLIGDDNRKHFTTAGSYIISFVALLACSLVLCLVYMFVRCSINWIKYNEWQVEVRSFSDETVLDSEE